LVYVKNSLKIPPDDGRITAEMRIGGHPYNRENSEKKTVLVHLLVQINQFQFMIEIDFSPSLLDRWTWDGVG
jgi:hypothetical protein